MKIDIDPTVDCVFKALLGSEENKSLLIHFLNAVMDLPNGERIKEVHLLNPVNEKRHQQDKLTVVDVKAIDESGNIYQVDVQRQLHAAIEERMGHNWATILGGQLIEGEDFSEVRPVVSIWLMGQPLFPTLPANLHRLRLSDSQTGAIIMARSGVCVLELSKINLKGPILSESDRWQRFFVEGKELDPDNLPDYMMTPEMEKAMETLKSFKEKGGERALQYIEERQSMFYRNTLINAAKRAKAELEEAEAKVLEAEAKVLEAEAKAEAKGQEAEAKIQEAEARAEAKIQEAEATHAQNLKLLAKLKELGVDPEAL